jgi:hypothetical protein
LRGWRVVEARLDIYVGKIREVCKDLSAAHTRCQI